MSRPHVAVLADCRFPIAEPFAGGLQSMTWHLVRGLRARGLEVTVVAAPGSDPSLGAYHLDTPSWQPSESARQDVSMPREEWLQEHHAYLHLMLELARSDVDLVHNNTLHHLPVALAELVAAPVVTTLHTPPTPWLESAIAVSAGRQHFAAVSRHTADAWRHVLPDGAVVVPNGVDTGRWPVGPGGDDLVWTGRITPEKAPHLAAEIARRAGRRLRLAGPISDPRYWREEVQPLLGDGVEYVGHLNQRALAELVGRSAACLVTPRWDEPYGLVAAEALSCGTPVLGFARGGLPEVVDETCARLVGADHVEAAAALVDEVARLDRGAARERAVTGCSMDAMTRAYVELYAELLLRPVAA